VSKKIMREVPAFQEPQGRAGRPPRAAEPQAKSRHVERFGRRRARSDAPYPIKLMAHWFREADLLF